MNNESADRYRAAWLKAEHEVDALREQLAEVKAEKVRAERDRDHWMQRYESLFQATRLAAGPET